MGRWMELDEFICKQMLLLLPFGGARGASCFVLQHDVGEGLHVTMDVGSRSTDAIPPSSYRIKPCQSS